MKTPLVTFYVELKGRNPIEYKFLRYSYLSNPDFSAEPPQLPREPGAKLTIEHEASFFKPYNWNKFRLYKEVSPKNNSRQRNKKNSIEGLMHEIKELEDLFFNLNRGLVYNMIGSSKGEKRDFDELESEANLALLNSIRTFDYARGFKFSTYACNSITRRIFRSFRRVEKSRNFNSDFGDEDLFSDQAIVDFQRRQLDSIVLPSSLLTKNLNETEREIIQHRFPLDETERQTFDLLGKRLGFSKERARQIQVNALKKMRQTLENYENGRRTQLSA